ncbi:plasmid recombination protein [Enterobacter kobei]|uniref:plasmid recombination protein n=2 Tax=Enterobacter cloacae complex TaxID=354276 RepID=UPI0029DA02AE|nr:plasmid recombination protein [Enterobacter kobei]MDX7052280.1 plasmid recombination protein [Enterobacter kobei]
MSYQFIHIESYARVGSNQKGKSTKWNIHQIAGEAMRNDEDCKHVEHPQEPTVLFGVDAYAAADMAQKWAETSVDASGRKLRKDGSCLLAGVISFPEGRTEADWKAFRDDSIKYLKEKYGENLKSVIEHRDEAFKHIHFYSVPKPGQKFEDIHDGKKAVLEAKKGNSKILKGDQNRVYIQAMKEFQEDFYQNVAIKHGMTKTGPKRERLTREEWKARKEYALKQSEEIKNISLLKDQAIHIGKKEGFDYSVEQSKGWGWIAKIGAKYKYYTDDFKKKLEKKDEEIEVVKNQRNEQQKKHRAFKKEYYSQKKETEKAVKEKKEKSKEVYFLNNENKELKKNNDILEVENLSLREENKILQQYKITSKKMRDRFPDEYKAMEAEINKPRPKGESYNPEPKAQELSIQQEEDRTNQYTKRPRM